MSASNKTNYNKNDKYWKKKKPVSCHTYLILFATIFNAI